MARDNQLKGLKAGQAASLHLRWVAVGDAAGLRRNPSARHQVLLTLSGIWLVQIQASALGLKSWGPSPQGQADVKLRSLCPKVGIKDKLKGPPSSPWSESPRKYFLLSGRTAEPCRFLSGGSVPLCFPKSCFSLDLQKAQKEFPCAC